MLIPDISGGAGGISASDNLGSDRFESHGGQFGTGGNRGIARGLSDSNAALIAGGIIATVFVVALILRKK